MNHILIKWPFNTKNKMLICVLFFFAATFKSFYMRCCFSFFYELYSIKGIYFLSQSIFSLCTSVEPETYTSLNT